MDVPPPSYEVPVAPERPQPVPVSHRKLANIPGVTVTYYDAVGATIPKLYDWLTRHGPRDSQTHKVTPASSSWSIGTSVKWTRTGGQCRITDVTVKLIGSAKLPRLAPGQKLSAPVLASWNAYVAALEDRQAAQLTFVYDRLVEVEDAIMRSNCSNWQKAADAAIARLGQEQAQAFKPDPKAQPKLREPGSDF